MHFLNAMQILFITTSISTSKSLNGQLQIVKIFIILLERFFYLYFDFALTPSKTYFMPCQYPSTQRFHAMKVVTYLNAILPIPYDCSEYSIQISNYISG